MSRKIVILSVPRTGTRFFAYFVRCVVGEPVHFMHSRPKNRERIQDQIDRGNLLIIPVRDRRDHIEAFAKDPEYLPMIEECIEVMDEFMPQLEERAHLIDIDKNEKTHDQFARLLADMGALWTPAVTEFIDEWPKICSQHEKQDERCQQANAALRQQI